MIKVQGLVHISHLEGEMIQCLGTYHSEYLLTVVRHDAWLPQCDNPLPVLRHAERGPDDGCTVDECGVQSRRQWHDSVCETLHALQSLRLCVALQVHQHVADAQFLVAFDVIRDLL